MDNITNDRHFAFYNEYKLLEVKEEESNLYVGDINIMNLSEIEIMKQYAEIVTSNKKGRILEVGYGAGIFSRSVQDIGVDEHVIIECHPKLFENANEWAKGKNIKVLNDIWQNIIFDIGSFDGVFYDVTSPPGEAWNDLIKFIEICFTHLLNQGGIFTFWYCTNKIDKRILDTLQEYSSRLEIYSYEPDEQINWQFKTKNFVLFKAYK